MATTPGYLVLYITPRADVIQRPDGWKDTYLTGDNVTVDRDTFHLWDYPLPSPLPDPPVGTFVAEERDIARTRYTTELFGETAVNHSGVNNALRPVGSDGSPLPERLFRIRGPVSVAQEAGGIIPLYTLNDNRIPTAWGHAAEFWGVYTSAANHLTLHNYIATTLGFGPIAGAWAALDPNNQTQFLANAVQTALGLTNTQQLNRVTALRNALNTIGYQTPQLTAIVNAPAGKTEDTLVHALVSDLGFTMKDLQQTAMDFK